MLSGCFDAELMFERDLGLGHGSAQVLFRGEFLVTGAGVEGSGGVAVDAVAQHGQVGPVGLERPFPILLVAGLGALGLFTRPQPRRRDDSDNDVVLIDTVRRGDVAAYGVL